MDPATLIGLVVAFGAVLGAIVLEGANPMSVVLPAPMLLVIGGTIGAGLIGSTLKDTIFAYGSLSKALTFKPPKSSEAVETLIALADRARREGLLALEDAAKDIDDEFIRSGLQGAIDGTDPEDLRGILEDRITTKRNRDKGAAKYFADLGGYAPTVGIIGTVVSLVEVLENLNKPEELGHMIAAAFVATLWGLLTANLMFLPIAARLKRATEIECAHMELVLEGLMSVQAGANPRLVGERLRSLLPEERARKAKAAA